MPVWNKVSFDNVAEGNTSVLAIIEEIAKATSSQAGGIKNLTLTMDEMQTVIHENAAAAEQSASAAEELNAQAKEMQLYSDQLDILVGDHGKRHLHEHGGAQASGTFSAEEMNDIPAAKNLLTASR
ncbi:MAG: hypothetical protein HY789_01380 [Deltaproteobacteria bacterium]|nr:hypothetical protein [Deltaproteobacteria bacterium]